MKTQTMNKDVSSDWIISPIGPYLVEYSQFSSDTDSFPVMTSSRNGLMIQEEYYTKTQNSKLNKVGYHLVPPGYFTYRHMSDDSVFHFNINDTGKTVLVSPEYPVFTTKEMEPKFLLEYLNHSRLFLEFCKAQKKGSTRTRLYFNVLKQFVFPIPPLSQQQKIAEILLACERVLTLKKELKAQKIKQKKWLMQKLLNPVSGVRLPGFKENWEKSSLGKRVKTFSGGTPRRDCPTYYGGDIPWIKSGELNLLRIKKTEEYITEEGLVNSSAKLVKPGTLLLALYGATAGVLAISEIEAAINQAILALIPDIRLSSTFLFYYLSYIVPEAVKLLSQGAQPNLNAEVVKNLQISYPPLAEQSAIAEVLLAADRELDLLEEEIQAWERKKKALSQLLLRGIVRV